jgi:hypothetical protein
MNKCRVGPGCNELKDFHERMPCRLPAVWYREANRLLEELDFEELSTIEAPEHFRSLLAERLSTILIGYESVPITIFLMYLANYVIAMYGENELERLHHETYISATDIIPFEFTNVPSGYEVYNPRPLEINVLLRTSLFYYLRGMHENFKSKVRIDLSGAKEGQLTIPITRDLLPTDENQEILEFKPRSMELLLDEPKETKVEVRPWLFGKVRDGYRIRVIQVMPGTITANIAKSKMTRLPIIELSAIDVSSLENTVSARVSFHKNEYIRLPEESSMARVVIYIKKI